MGQTKRLGWLEFGRGVAALIVVISHATLVGAPRNDLVVWSGVAAVAFFFGLSGFIFLHVHALPIGQPPSAPFYLWRRVVRIFPTYWLVLFADIALHFASRSHPDLNLRWIIPEMFLLPGGEPFVVVAWTLRHELLFYGLFLVLILNARIGAAVFAVWFIAIVQSWITQGSLYWVSDVSRPPLQTLLSPINLLFFLGMALAWAMRRMPLSGFPAPRISYWFGRVSYPLYLSHLAVYFFIGGVFERLGIVLPWPLYLLVIVLACLFVAWLIANFFEDKLLWRLQKLVKVLS
jgi:exopolysaccharide production protein ExoZ